MQLTPSPFGQRRLSPTQPSWLACLFGLLLLLFIARLGKESESKRKKEEQKERAQKKAARDAQQEVSGVNQLKQPCGVPAPFWPVLGFLPSLVL